MDTIATLVSPFVTVVYHPWFVTAMWIVGSASVLAYLTLLFFQAFFDTLMPINLKEKYNAEWALVTGASSGIGKAIVEKLCEQNTNVVLVALDNDLLHSTFDEVSKKYPKLKFIKVACDLSQGDYMTPIIEATKDIDVQLVFNNAGFITAGMFHKISLGRNLGNFECNATSCIKITHHFVGRILDANLKGYIGFTSSSAGFVPNPLSAMYASTKAFLTLFATSIAPEIRSLGIDVVVVHPSPMATNFFDEASSLSALMAFKKFAAGPSVIADVLFNSAGRFVVRDQGTVSILFRLVMKVIDMNLFCELTARFAHLSGDHVKFNKKD